MERRHNINYLIQKFKNNFQELFKNNENDIIKIIDYLKSFDFISDLDRETISVEFQVNKCSFQNFHYIFHRYILYLDTQDLLKIIDGLSSRYSDLASLIRDDRKKSIQIIKSFHSRRLQSINLLPISQQKSPFVSVDKFYFPLTIAMYDNLKLSISLSHDDFIQRVFSSPTFSLIIGDAQSGKTTQIHRILYSWSMQESLLSDCFVLF